MIACSMPGKIGDLLHSLTAARELAERHACKVDFYTSEYCRPVTKFLKYQTYINDVIIPDDYIINSFDCGIQPWKMNIPDKYDAIYQLGFRETPDKFLTSYCSNLYNLPNSLPIIFEYPDITTLNKPYIIIAPRNFSIFLDMYKQFTENCPIAVVVLGAKHEYPGFGIDKTGLDLLESVAWIAKSGGIVGSGPFYVLAHGFSIPKILPIVGGMYDMRHHEYSNLHYYIDNPTPDKILGALKLTKTLSKTLNINDYTWLGDYAKHFDNLLDHCKFNKFDRFRYEHPHRKWEYAVMYKAIDSVNAKTILDVGGGGSLFSMGMSWIDKDITQLDPGDVDAWISDQNKFTGKTIKFIKKDFMIYNGSEKYDAVVCNSVIEHVPNDLEFLAHLASYVEDGGILVLTTDFHPSGKAVCDGHITTYNVDGMSKFIELLKDKGFEYFGGKPNYSYYEQNVNSATFCSLVMRKKETYNEY